MQRWDGGEAWMEARAKEKDERKARRARKMTPTKAGYYWRWCDNFAEADDRGWRPVWVSDNPILCFDEPGKEDDSLSKKPGRKTVQDDGLWGPEILHPSFLPTVLTSRYADRINPEGPGRQLGEKARLGHLNTWPDPDLDFDDLKGVWWCRTMSGRELVGRWARVAVLGGRDRNFVFVDESGEQHTRDGVGMFGPICFPILRQFP